MSQLNRKEERMKAHEMRQLHNQITKMRRLGYLPTPKPSKLAAVRDFFRRIKVRINRWR